MAKRDEFDFEEELGFDPKEFLDDEAADTAEELDLSSDLFLEEEAPNSDDAELEELLDPNFLASLGIVLDEEAPEEVEEEDVQEPVQTSLFDEESPAPKADYPLDEDPDSLERFDLDMEPLDGMEDFSFDLDAQEEEEEEMPQEPVPVYTPAPEPAFEVEPELGEDFAAAFEKDFPDEGDPAQLDEPPVPVVEPINAPVQPATPRRRKKLSKERIIKEVYLPPIIAGLALILILTFIGTAISRGVAANKDKEGSIAASQQASSGALDQEAQLLMDEAQALADVYDYEAAIAKLDSFSGEMAKYQSMMDLYNTFTQAKDKLVPFEDFASIPNLSFHGLIADPSRAFVDETYGKSYLNNYVTVDEFAKILQQLYNNGYVLVDFDSFIVETTGEDGKTTYSTQPLYLPQGKKPLMLTQTLVNYEIFTIDSDGDWEADKGGDGFASKLIVDDNGEILNEYVDAQGNTVTGAYDLVPILNDFLKANPDFSYRGARAILAVTGEDGVFGYRIMNSAKEKKGEDYYNQQVEGAKKVAQALRDQGYTIGCYTYSNIPYGETSATKIQVDLDNWSKEVTPVLGEIDLLVYAKASDISADGGYSGNNKYNVLYSEGFRYFISSANVPWAEVTNEYVRQSRIMVTGSNMKNTPSVYTTYFDASAVLNELRGS